jgi:hypothetical protein
MLNKIIRLQKSSAGNRYAELLHSSRQTQREIYYLCTGKHETPHLRYLSDIVLNADLRQVRTRYWRRQLILSKSALKHATGQDVIDLRNEIKLINEELVSCQPLVEQ